MSVRSDRFAYRSFGSVSKKLYHIRLFHVPTIFAASSPQKNKVTVLIAEINVW